MAYVRTGSVGIPERPMPLPTGQASVAGITLSSLLLLAAAGIGVWYFMGLAGKGYRRNQARRPRPRRAAKRKWIKKAIKKPGALRSWVNRRYGAKGFDSQGRIKMSVLRRHYHDPGKLGKRVRLAMTLRRM